MVVAAVVDPEESLATQGAEALMYEASKGFHADIREAFAFGVLDGRRWDEYIATFDLRVSDLPRVLVLDRPAERFFDEYRPPETGDGCTCDGRGSPPGAREAAHVGFLGIRGVARGAGDSPKPWRAAQPRDPSTTERPRERNPAGKEGKSG